MKKILHLIAGLVCPILLFSQAPSAFNYQAVARDQAGEVLVNQNLDVRFSIRESSGSGSIVYQEDHATSTNDFGLFAAAVGDGNVVSGDFSAISWGTNAYYLEVEVDDGSGYQSLGTTQLLSVPYALHSNTSGSSGGYSAGDGISISGNIITNTGDTNPADDITTSTNAEGDASGIFPTLTVTGIQTRPVSQNAPANGQVLKWNGSEWAPANDEGGAGGSSPWSTSGSDIYYTNGNVGVGISNPTAALDVRGTMELSTGGANNEDFAIGVSPLGELSFYPNNDYSENIFFFDDESAYFTIDNYSSSIPNGLRLNHDGGFKGALIYQPDDDIVNLTRDAIFNRIVLDADNNVVIAGETGDNNAALTINSQYNNGRIKLGSSEYIEDGGAFSIDIAATTAPATDDEYALGKDDQRWTEVYATNGVINTSDARQKKQISAIGYGIDDIMKLNPVTYQMEGDQFADPHVGFLAQDLLDVFPEVVKTHYDVKDEESGEVTRQPAEIYGVYYHRLIPILVKSIQQQQLQIKALEQEIEQLK